MDKKHIVNFMRLYPYTDNYRNFFIDFHVISSW